MIIFRFFLAKRERPHALSQTTECTDRTGFPQTQTGTVDNILYVTSMSGFFSKNSLSSLSPRISHNRTSLRCRWNWWTSETTISQMEIPNLPSGWYGPSFFTSRFVSLHFYFFFTPSLWFCLTCRDSHILFLFRHGVLVSLQHRRLFRLVAGFNVSSGISDKRDQFSFVSHVQNHFCKDYSLYKCNDFEPQGSDQATHKTPA